MYIPAYVAYKHVFPPANWDPLDPVRPTSVRLVRCWAQVTITKPSENLICAVLETWHDLRSIFAQMSILEVFVLTQFSLPRVFFYYGPT